MNHKTILKVLFLVLVCLGQVVVVPQAGVRQNVAWQVNFSARSGKFTAPGVRETPDYLFNGDVAIQPTLRAAGSSTSSCNGRAEDVLKGIQLVSATDK
jgi:hypothetical protein